MFGIVFALGAAVIALWVDQRFPQLAPSSLTGRLTAVLVSSVIVMLVPVVPTSREALIASLFVGVFPSFVLAFLSALWLLRGVRDMRGA